MKTDTFGIIAAFAILLFGLALSMNKINTLRGEALEWQEAATEVVLASSVTRSVDTTKVSPSTLRNAIDPCFMAPKFAGDYCEPEGDPEVYFTPQFLLSEDYDPYRTMEP